MSAPGIELNEIIGEQPFQAPQTVVTSMVPQIVELTRGMQRRAVTSGDVSSAENTKNIVEERMEAGLPLLTEFEKVWTKAKEKFSMQSARRNEPPIEQLARSIGVFIEPLTKAATKNFRAEKPTAYRRLKQALDASGPADQESPQDYLYQHIGGGNMTVLAFIDVAEKLLRKKNENDVRARLKKLINSANFTALNVAISFNSRVSICPVMAGIIKEFHDFRAEYDPEKFELIEVDGEERFIIKPRIMDTFLAEYEEFKVRAQETEILVCPGNGIKTASGKNLTYDYVKWLIEIATKQLSFELA